MELEEQLVRAFALKNNTSPTLETFNQVQEILYDS
jgi:hypothetical protein